MFLNKKNTGALQWESACSSDWQHMHRKMKISQMSLWLIVLWIHNCWRIRQWKLHSFPTASTYMKSVTCEGKNAKAILNSLKKTVKFQKLQLRWLVVALLKEAPLQFKLLVLLSVSHTATFNTSVYRKVWGIISNMELHAGNKLHIAGFLFNYKYYTCCTDDSHIKIHTLMVCFSLWGCLFFG